MPSASGSTLLSPLDSPARSLVCAALAAQRARERRCSLDAFCTSSFPCIGNAFRARLHPNLRPSIPRSAARLAVLARRIPSVPLPT